MRTVEVEVTQDDIDAGCPRSTGGCPIALAMSRVIRPDRYLPTVGAEVFGFVDEHYLLVFTEELPLPAQRFVSCYDDDDGREFVRPFKFEIWIPDVMVTQRGYGG